MSRMCTGHGARGMGHGEEAQGRLGRGEGSDDRRKG